MNTIGSCNSCGIDIPGDQVECWSCWFCWFGYECQCTETDATGRRCERSTFVNNTHRGIPHGYVENGALVWRIEKTPDPVEHPAHYTAHPSGVECIAITEHFGFCIGNAIKYLWRAGLKGDALEDLRKARWYIDREIKRRGGS